MFLKNLPGRLPGRSVQKEVVLSSLLSELLSWGGGGLGLCMNRWSLYLTTKRPARVHKASPTIKRCLCLLQLLPPKGVFTFLTLTDGLTQFSFLVSVFYKLCLDESHTEECPTKHLNPSSHGTATEVDWTPGK